MSAEDRKLAAGTVLGVALAIFGMAVQAAIFIAVFKLVAWVLR